VIEIAVHNAHPRRRIPRGRVVETVTRVVRGERRSHAQISVVFTDSSRIARLNARYLQHRGSTDVISFSLGAPKELEGEIYVNLDRARSQARTYGVPYALEVSRLVVHGTLHLLGYDDATEQSRLRMKRYEDRYLGLPARRPPMERVE